jgi:hypothetical protein
MFDPDAHMPRINRGMVYLGACFIAGIRLARERQVPITKNLFFGLSLAKIRSRRSEQLILVLGINLGTDSRPRKVHARTH